MAAGDTTVVYPNLLRTWRRLVRRGHLAAASSAHFVPIRVLETASTPAAIPPSAADRLTADMTEITLPDGS